MSRKKREATEQKKKETRKFVAIMCSLVFCFAAAVPVILYFAAKKNKRIA